MPSKALVSRLHADNCKLSAVPDDFRAWRRVTSSQHNTQELHQNSKTDSVRFDKRSPAVLALPDGLLGLWLAPAASRPPSTTAGPRCADGPQRCIRALPGAMPLSACDRLAARAQPACASAALPAARLSPCGLPAEPACTARPGRLPPAPIASARATRWLRLTPETPAKHSALLHARKGIANLRPIRNPALHLCRQAASVQARDPAQGDGRRKGDSKL